MPPDFTMVSDGAWKVMVGFVVFLLILGAAIYGATNG